MTNYDFRALNNEEFERLATDLLSKRENMLIERFKSGKDGGIDGRFYHSGEVIIQVKHYVKTGYSGLLSKLKSEEVAKVENLKPNRYIFITSVGLSPANKKEIYDLFNPYIRKNNDIIGPEYLNDLLTLYPEIERNHYKLWLSSTNFLISLLNNATIQNSNFLIEDARKESYKFIKTKQLKKALEILDENKVVIITGLPGVGKTTLAKQVMLMHCNSDYEVYYIEGSISEVDSLYFKEKKQFFYFDDFLGATLLEIFTKNSDSKIVQFIKKIITDKNKKMILTSRTNILNRAKNLSEIFNIEKIEKKEFEINVSDLTDIEKAEILYNHVWHSSLPQEYIDTFYDNRNYWKIIHHSNFNPRLISFITDSDRISGIDSSNFWSYIENSLDNPEMIWSHCFNNQTREEVLDLVCLVVFNANNIEERDCKKALKCVFNIKYKNNFHSKVNKMDEYIKESIKSTLNRILIPLNEENIMIRLTPFNPSVSDYIINRYASDETSLSLYFSALKTNQSINTLFSLHSNRKINSDVFVSVLESVLNAVDLEYLNNYSTHLLHSIIHSNLISTNKNRMVYPSLFLNIKEEYLTYDYKVGECVLWAVKNAPSLFSDQFISDFINYAMRSNWRYTLNHNDYLPLAHLINLRPAIKGEEVTHQLMEHIKEYWYENYDEYLSGTGKIQSLDYDERSKADDIAYDMLHDLINEYDFPFEDNEIEYMYSKVDASTHLDDSYVYDENVDKRNHFYSHRDEKEHSESYINDLFQKH
ncbi:restriction endonuclease [Morganella morganii]|uniref:nSTAND3 domain-containing NTPase n=1 Tax=Morganella morganii TaxID=582 RepID=UPI003EB9C997